MRSKAFIAILAAFCLLLVVGMSDYAYAEGSPYDDNPFGDEHPWGGDNVGDDGGSGVDDDSDGSSSIDLPSIISTPYFIQSISLNYFWNTLSRYIDKSVPVQSYEIKYISTSRSTGKKTSPITVSEGARNK